MALGTTLAKFPKASCTKHSSKSSILIYYSDDGSSNSESQLKNSCSELYSPTFSLYDSKAFKKNLATFDMA